MEKKRKIDQLAIEERIISEDAHKTALRCFIAAQVERVTSSDDPVVNSETSAELDYLKQSTTRVELDQTWWIDREVFDYSFPAGDSRRFFIEGNVCSSEKNSFTVEYLHPLTNTVTREVIRRAERVSHQQHKEESQLYMRCFDWRDIEDCNIFAHNIRERIMNRASHQIFFNKSRPLAQGEKVDFYISHSQTDDGDLKYSALKLVSEEFHRIHGRYPTFWSEGLCIDFESPDGSLFYRLYRNGNGFMSHCKQLLILAGSTYCKRLWCLFEIFAVFMSCKILSEKVVIVPLEKIEDNRTNVISEFEHFVFNDKVISINPNETLNLHTIIAAAGHLRFERCIRQMTEDIVYNFCRRRGGLAMRMTLLGDSVSVSGHYAHRLRSGPRPPRTHVFLTHNWSEDTQGRDNHLRASQVNDALKARGFITWFDSDRLIGDIRRQMTDGIDNTLCFVVFITSLYESKVNGNDGRDNCQYEFNYAIDAVGTHKMIPVVMERQMKKKWTAALGGALNSKLYVDLSSNFDDQQMFNAKIDELCNAIKHAIGDPIPDLSSG